MYPTQSTIDLASKHGLDTVVEFDGVSIRTHRREEGKFLGEVEGRYSSEEELVRSLEGKEKDADEMDDYDVTVAASGVVTVEDENQNLIAEIGIAMPSDDGRRLERWINHIAFVNDEESGGIKPAFTNDEILEIASHWAPEAFAEGDIFV